VHYDAFKHLCHSLFKSTTDLFAMITAYFDDSGTSQSNSVAAVAGYIGSVAQWERFGIEWNNLLHASGVSQMHRTDLESFYGEFAGWTPQKRDVLVNKAQEIIKDRTYVGIGHSVVKEDFERILPQILQEFYGGPYGYCAFLCIARAIRWHGNKKISEPLDWVFEAGTEGSGQFNMLMSTLYANPDMRRDFKVNGWAFRDKTVVPLQAADVLAYEMFKHVTNQIVGKGEKKVRISFNYLIRPQDDDYLEYWPQDRLEEYVESKTTQDLMKNLIAHNFGKRR
jgi:hypothetical protein